MTIRDANYFWHATKQIGNRLVTLCGYINTDANNVERNGFPVSDTERPTCKRCLAEEWKQMPSPIANDDVRASGMEEPRKHPQIS